MAFFPRYHEASFTPLFRLLDDFDSYSRQGQNGCRTARPAVTFQPKFDVRELEDHFELHGELAGLKKEDVHIEFTDPHTLRIHGRVERNYTSAPTPAAAVEGASPNGAVTDDDNKSTTSAKSHQATVEDEDAEWTDGAENPKPQIQAQPAQKPQKQATPRAKFWCSERSIGEFNRTFNFPGQVQQDAVSASLDNGILTIAIPKAPKHEARRIAIN